MVLIAGAASLAVAESMAEAKQQLMTQRQRIPEQAQVFDDGFGVGLAYFLQVSVLIAICVSDIIACPVGCYDNLPS